MAKTAIEKSLVQFNGCDERFFNREIALDESNRDDNDDDDDEACENMATKIYPFLRTEEQVADILKHSKEQFLGLVVFTFADPTLRENTTRMCELSGMQYVDLLGPMLDAMTVFFERPSRGFSRPDKPPNSLRALSDSYYRKIEAVEFTLKCDDGRSPHLLEQADVVLLGVSRTGKTPLSVVISQTMGLKVANVPLVVDLSPPKQLTELDPRRVFCLTLSPRELQRIRRNRIRRELSRQKSDDALPAGATRSTYADPDYLQRDLAHARDIAVAYGFTEVRTGPPRPSSPLHGHVSPSWMSLPAALRRLT
jgi:regulator of PEP synthase PpsR (kinase-PPPase family)